MDLKLRSTPTDAKTYSWRYDMDPKQKEIDAFKKKYYAPSNILKKPPRGGWKYIMSREEKRFRNRWNTESKPYTPTPKGDSLGKKKDDK